MVLFRGCFRRWDCSRRLCLQGVLAPSATPHTALLEERKKELGINMMKYSAKFMLQFAEVRSMRLSVDKSMFVPATSQVLYRTPHAHAHVYINRLFCLPESTANELVNWCIKRMIRPYTVCCTS